MKDDNDAKSHENGDESTAQAKKPRQTVSALQEQLDRAREDNEALKLQLEELTEKFMLFQGGASPVAEPETPADEIAPSESNPDVESIDALLERIESAFVDAVPATHMGAAR